MGFFLMEPDDKSLKSERKKGVVNNRYERKTDRVCTIQPLRCKVKSLTRLSAISLLTGEAELITRYIKHHQSILFIYQPVFAHFIS